MASALMLLGLFVPALTFAQSKGNPSDKFRQLEELLPTPNDQRAASGAPGHAYWQQRADYNINVELDDVNQRLTGSETITYYNNSPDSLSYLWLQLDQNIWAKTSETYSSQTAPNFDRIPFSTIDNLLARRDFDGGHRITAVRDAKGAALPYTIVKTMMRIDLPRPLAPGQSTAFSVDWNYNINDQRRIGGRTGYE
ncbi:MAG: aminopeptidase, partial [Acidobacteria bacterium]|nr:aminopeptidase [Acidobacteriota bacterium]